jgi:hypothetical protein
MLRKKGETQMKKWIWITVPAVAVGLGLIFVGGAAFAQTPNGTGPSVNWTSMYNYCRNFIAGNNTAADPDFDQMRGYCQNATESGNYGGCPVAGTGYNVGPNGMMGGGYAGRGMMNW